MIEVTAKFTKGAEQIGTAQGSGTTVQAAFDDVLGRLRERIPNLENRWDEIAIRVVRADLHRPGPVGG